MTEVWIERALCPAEHQYGLKLVPLPSTKLVMFGCRIVEHSSNQVCWTSSHSHPRVAVPEQPQHGSS